jgi:hypothetical protein
VILHENMNVVDFLDTFYRYTVLVEDSLARVPIAQSDQMIVDDEVCLSRLQLNLGIDPEYEMLHSILKVIRKVIAPETEMVSAPEQALFEDRNISTGGSVTLLCLTAPVQLNLNGLATVRHSKGPERHRMAEHFLPLNNDPKHHHIHCVPSFCPVDTHRLC